MTVISEEYRPSRVIRPDLPPRPDYSPADGGRTEKFVLSLSGVLPLVYEQAWQAVLDGTPLCRTALRRTPDGGLRRTVRADARFHLHFVDWRATRPEVQDARLSERLTRESITGLPLDQAPLMCATLIRRDDRTWTFAWRFAHELMDRRAGLRLLEGATEAYEALLRGGTPRRADTRLGGDSRLVGPVGR
ncbi:condensation domain-containing protein [Streptomyces sp. NPDC055036]